MKMYHILYTVSMNFRRKQQVHSGAEFAYGYLDDSLIISFGLEDMSSYFVEIEVEDILRDHEICNDLN